MTGTRRNIPDPGSPRIYLAITWRHLANANRQFMAMRVSSNGVPEPAFAGGTVVLGFDQPGSDLSDVATRIAVRTRLQGGIQDDILLVGRVARACRTGVGVVRLRHNGQLETAFGNGGRLLFGGSAASAAFCSGFNPAQDLVTGAAVNGHRLALTGTSNCVDCPGEGFLAMVDIEAGKIGER